MENLFADPAHWVALAFVILIAALYRKLTRAGNRFLDERSAKIDEELKTARRLREEAEEILAVYKKKQAEYTKEAESILRKAREDADIMAAHADKELKAALDARMQHALEKIAQEETRAINDVREHIVDISLAAAKAVIIQNIGNSSQQELLKNALSDIERKIH